MRSTTRGSLSFCAWRRTSSSLEMVALFPFANVGRILPIIAHFSEYVELFMRTYIGRRTEPPPVPHNSPLQALYLRSKWRPVVPTDCVLFGAKGENGVNGGGFARGQVAGKESRGKAGRNTNRYAEQSQCERFAQNHPTNTSLLRAKRDANADFARATRDAI